MEIRDEAAAKTVIMAACQNKIAWSDVEQHIVLSKPGADLLKRALTYRIHDNLRDFCADTEHGPNIVLKLRDKYFVYDSPTPLLNKVVDMLQSTKGLATGPVSLAVTASVILGFCANCGRAMSNVLLPQISTSAKIKFPFDLLHTPTFETITTFMVARLGASGAYLATVTGLCHDCFKACRVCSRQAGPAFNIEEITQLHQEQLCLNCGGDSLVKIGNPKPLKKDLRELRKKESWLGG